MPWTGTDFEPTQPGEIREYSIDFSDDIAVLYSRTLTIGGTPTAGDQLSVSIASPALTGGSVAVSYIVQAADTLDTIAAALAALLAGSDPLIAASVSVTVSNAVVTVEFAPTLDLAFANSATAAAGSTSEATETMEFGEGALGGETLETPVVAVCQAYTGNPDPAASAVIGSPTISGTKVSVQTSGTQLAGTTYRISLQPTTSTGNKPVLFQHLPCVAAA